MSSEEKANIQKKYRKNMIFEQGPDGDRAIAFLETCGRKQGIITTLALLELIEKYGLERLSQKEILNFANSYKFIRAATQNNNNINLAFAPQVPIAPTYNIPATVPYDNNAKEKELESEKQRKETEEAKEINDVKNQTNDLLSSLGLL